jgi:hypothetical protein
LKKNKKARITPGDKETTLKKNKVGRKPKIQYWCENCYIPLHKHVFAIIEVCWKGFLKSFPYL